MAPDRDQYSPAWITFLRITCGPLLRCLYFYTSEGADRIPAEGPVILAPNHTSYMDPFLVVYPVRRPIYFLAWNALFRAPISGPIIPRLGAVPLDVKARADRGAWRCVRDLLGAGRIVCIFPEGIRGWDSSLNPIQAGVARLSAATGAPIVPVWIDGAVEAWPRWRLLPRAFVPIRVRFLEPIRPGGEESEKGRAQSLHRRLEEALLAASREARRFRT